MKASIEGSPSYKFCYVMKREKPPHSPLKSNTTKICYSAVCLVIMTAILFIMFLLPSLLFQGGNNWTFFTQFATKILFRMHSKSSRSSSATAQSRAVFSPRNIIITIASIAIGYPLILTQWHNNTVSYPSVSILISRVNTWSIQISFNPVLITHNMNRL